ncbi:MAG: hypothetical protein JXB38_02590 [Anaerolineales bacterium]|nr:hypothetical protein [Anaerolineales bacterium]
MAASQKQLPNVDKFVKIVATPNGIQVEALGYRGQGCGQVVGDVLQILDATDADIRDKPALYVQHTSTQQTQQG